MNFDNLIRPVDPNGEKFTQLQEFNFEKGLFDFRFWYVIDEDYTIGLSFKAKKYNKKLKLKAQI